VLGV
jgi:hypothetical protein